MTPYLLILLPVVFQLILQAAVLYFFRLVKAGKALGLSVLINAAGIIFLYFIAAPFVGRLGYNMVSFDGLKPEPAVLAFFWWCAVMLDGLLLLLFLRQHNKYRLFLASLVMNTLSLCYFLLLLTL